MRSISSRDRRTLLAAFVVLTIVAETAAYLATTPRQNEQFFQFYVLGMNRRAGAYYPQNDTNVHIASPVTWYVGVTNSMGNVQLVEIKLKLGNETTTSPNDTTSAPSSAPELVTFNRFLANNETWEFRFSWSITNATATAASTHILSIQINNQTYRVSDWSATGGQNFRFILELWVWETSTDTFEFGWSSGGERRAAWLEVWFDMTNPR